MKISAKTAKSMRAVDTGELVKRIREGLDAARRMGVLSGTMVREGDDGPVIVKMGSRPLVAKAYSADELRAFAEEAGIPWDDGYEDRVVEVWASDERVDRDGDIVEQSSWDFANFAKNPLVLWGHEWEAPPIGNAIRWAVENRKDDDYEGPALRLTELFAPGDASPQAESVLRLAKAGFLRSGSVGFFPGEVVSPESDEAREELGLSEGGYFLRKCELIEHSHCSVPSNPGAINILATAKAAGGLASTDIAAIRELARQDALVVGREDVWSRMDSALRRAWNELYPDVRIEDHASIAHPIMPDSAVERSAAPAKVKDDDPTSTGDDAATPDTAAPGDDAATPGDDATHGDDVADADTKKTPEERVTVVESSVALLTEAIATLTADVGDLKAEFADFKSDADGASRESEQERSAALSALLSDLRETSEKVLASGKDGGNL